jgi:neutral ceramidase
MRIKISLLLCIVGVLALLAFQRGESATATPDNTGPGEFLIGAGIYDITGPAAELGMMGYSMPEQKTEGIHMRLRSRAFVVADAGGGKRIAFASAEAGILPQGIKQEVVNKLWDRFGDLYNDKNVAISATHTHAGPGAYSHYALYDLAMLGYDDKHFECVAEGVFQSIVRAHDNLEKGHIKINKGEPHDAGWNRSPAAYANNPAEERARYEWDTDKTMTLLRFEANSGEQIGLVNWFAVHPTNLSNMNKLISGDNKGYASYLFEEKMGADYATSRPFVAAFAENNAGDVSPNIIWGYPNGVDDFDHMKSIGERQFRKAVELYDSATEVLRGGVDYGHVYIDSSDQSVSPEFMPDKKARGHTCVAAIGVAMLAGSSEDGKGLDIEEGITYPMGIEAAEGSFPWRFTLLPEDQECHAEKPIAMPMGRVRPQGIPLTPEVLPVQILRIGNLAIVAQPTEITTMAGRRLRETVKTAFGGQVDHVVISALSNAYAGYVATREEYALQHYEGASTHFGPYTLNALQEQFHRVATAMANGEVPDPGPSPRKIRDKQILQVPGVLFDDIPPGKDFGDISKDANASYARGDTVEVTFWSGHPKNDYQNQGTFLVVETVKGEDEPNAEGARAEDVEDGFVEIADDGAPETIYQWKRVGVAYSKATIKWDTADTKPGRYRIRHLGHWKSGWTGEISAYEGTSSVFALE